MQVEVIIVALKECFDYMMVFASYNSVVYLYQRLAQKGYEVIIMNTPCRISSSCSQAIRFKAKDKEDVLCEASKINVIPRGLYKVVRGNNQETYELLE